MNFTLEQREQRRQGLGGSDMAALLGLDKRKSRYALYLEKTEGIEESFENNSRIQYGQRLEPFIASLYEEETGYETFQTERIDHPSYPYFFASPDRLVRSSDKKPKRGLEIKNVAADQAKHWGVSGGQKIPEWIYPQPMHYLFVLDYDLWDVAAFIGGNDLRIYTFERDPEFDAIIAEEGTKFWRQHIEKRIAPDMDYTSAGLALLKKKFSKIEQETTAVLSDDILHWKNVWQDAKKRIIQYQNVADGAQAHILEALENREKGTFSDGSFLVRKRVSVKEYVVPAREDIRLCFKESQPIGA